MSLDAHRESVWAFRELMKMSERDVNSAIGEIRPARILFRRVRKVRGVWSTARLAHVFSIKRKSA